MDAFQQTKKSEIARGRFHFFRFVAFAQIESLSAQKSNESNQIAPLTARIDYENAHIIFIAKIHSNQLSNRSNHQQQRSIPSPSPPPNKKPPKTIFGG